ncbi:MAG: hypothetical protein K6G06_05815 [Butyrivibrio sp.]|nr:hypothetical protein [Butyrivibrio sp.]
MKKRFLAIAFAATMIMSGCGNAESETALTNEDPAAATEGETLEENAALEESTEESAVAAVQDVNDAEDVTDVEVAGAEDAAEVEVEADDTKAGEDYTEQIKTEIGEIAGSDSLADEMTKVDELYKKYDDLRMNAETQVEMDEMAQWPTLVWETEVESLMERIEKTEDSSVADIKSAYDEWSSNVDAIAEKMSFTYEGGSIQGMITVGNKATLCRNKAYGLAASLADINKETDFEIPATDPYGIYGDFSKGNYIILTEGMESGSYNVLISTDAGEITGTAVDGEGEKELAFTSDDDTIKGSVTYDNTVASFTVSESDGSVVKADDVFDFDLHY